MNKLVQRFGKLRTASFFVMGVGVILFLLTPLFLTLLNWDTDIIGVMIAEIGLFIFTLGTTLSEKQKKEKASKLKLGLLIAAASILAIPILSLIASLIYFLITGKPLGE